MHSSLAACASTAGTAGVSSANEKSGNRPLVIGHRGASGHRPEHTLASYQLAIELGADFVEPDLVPTRDGVLVMRHENEISGTTDVAAHPEFADRRRKKRIDGSELYGWFTEDFTLAELKTLRARERLAAVRPDNARYDGMYEIPTFDELLELLARERVRRGRPLGIYPETKHPTYFASIGLPLEERLLAALERHGYRGRGAPVFIQSFEVGNLRKLRRATEFRLVQLVDSQGAPVGGGPAYAEMVTPAGLGEVATYADAVAPEKRMVIPRDGQDRLLAPTSLVQDAHGAGLAVHVYTFRDEDSFLPANLRGKPIDELLRFFEAGIDAAFADSPDTAVAARQRYWSRSL
jgi:glycerophosphoryl diester phosphodiesterase